MDLDVSIIIVSWNVSQHLERCLRSIPAALGALRGEVLVIDNASSDGSADAADSFAAEMPHLTVIRNPENLGFAKGCNMGLRRGRGEYLLLLNPDTQLHANAIATLVACAKTNRAAAVGARHVTLDKTPQPSVRRLPTWPVLALLLLKLHRVVSSAPVFARYFARDFDYLKTQPAEQPAGSCLLLSRGAVEQVGFLDERYYNWFEEVDWCRRAGDAGLAVWYCAEALVTHAGGQSFGKLHTLNRQRQFNRSLLAYVKKHHGVFPWLLLGSLQPISLLLTWVSQFIRLPPAATTDPASSSPSSL